jgi:hypothetical protein
MSLAAVKCLYHLFSVPFFAHHAQIGMSLPAQGDFPLPASTPRPRGSCGSHIADRRMSELPGKRCDGTKHRLPRHYSVCRKSSRFVVSRNCGALSCIGSFATGFRWNPGRHLPFGFGPVGSGNDKGFLSRFARRRASFDSGAALASGYFAAPSIGRQMDDLADRLPRSIERLEKQINDYHWGRRLLSETKDKDAPGRSEKHFFTRDRRHIDYPGFCREFGDSSFYRCLCRCRADDLPARLLLLFPRPVAMPKRIDAA